MSIRWLLAGGWVVVVGVITMGFVLDGVNDPQALPFVVALGAVVATLLVTSVVCLLKGRTRIGVAGLVSVAALPVAHYGSMPFWIEGWAPTFFVDVVAIGFVFVMTVAIGGMSLRRASEGSVWVRRHGPPETPNRVRNGGSVGMLVMILLG